MSEIKSSGSRYSFEDIAKRLYNVYDDKDTKKKKLQFSFITKLIHTTDNEVPIYDKYVKIALDLKISQCKDINERIANRKEIVDSLSKLYANLASDPNFSSIIGDFDKTFPAGSKISFVKKCDFILWALGAKITKAKKVSKK